MNRSSPLGHRRKSVCYLCFNLRGFRDTKVGEVIWTQATWFWAICAISNPADPSFLAPFLYIYLLLPLCISLSRLLTHSFSLAHLLALASADLQRQKLLRVQIMRSQENQSNWNRLLKVMKGLLYDFFTSKFLAIANSSPKRSHFWCRVCLLVFTNEPASSRSSTSTEITKTLKT